MPKIGKNAPIVQIIHAKTKGKTEDIIDFLKVLSEATAEAFFIENPVEKQPVNFGPFTIHWKETNLGPGMFFKPSKLFKEQVTAIKCKQITPLAALLFEKMLPFNKKEAKRAIDRKSKNIGNKIIEKTKKTAESSAKQDNYRIKSLEKQKKQAILLNAIK